MDDITDMRRSCRLRENTSGWRPLGSSSRLLKVPNDDDDGYGCGGVRGDAISSPGVSLGTDEFGGWCGDDNHDEGVDHSKFNVKSRNIEKHCLM